MECKPYTSISLHCGSTAFGRAAAASSTAVGLNEARRGPKTHEKKQFTLLYGHMLLKQCTGDMVHLVHVIPEPDTLHFHPGLFTPPDDAEETSEVRELAGLVVPVGMSSFHNSLLSSLTTCAASAAQPAVVERLLGLYDEHCAQPRIAEARGDHILGAGLCLRVMFCLPVVCACSLPHLLAVPRGRADGAGSLCAHPSPKTGEETVSCAGAAASVSQPKQGHSQH